MKPRQLPGILVAALCLMSFDPRALLAKAIDFDTLISLGRVSDPQVSPDGKLVAFVVNYQDVDENKGNSDIYIIPIKGGDAKRLTRSPKGDSHPRFSPDGEWIAFHSSRSGEQQVWILPTSGGEPRQVTKLSTGASSPEWFPNGERLLFRSDVYPDCPDDDCNKTRDEEKTKSKVEARIFTELFYRHWDEWSDEKVTHLFSVAVDGNDVSDLTPGDVNYPTVALGSGHDIALAPDGSEICATGNPNDNAERNINNDLFVLSANGGSPTQITESLANDNHPVYSPDGRFIAYRAMSRPGFEADEYRLKVYDRTSRQTTDVGAELADKHDRSVASITWSPESKYLYVTARDMGQLSLYHVERKSGKVKKLIDDMYVRSLQVTPNGRTLVFRSEDARSPYEIFTASASGGNVRQLTHINDAKLADVERHGLEPFAFEGAGGTTVHGYLLRPPGFDPDKKYPVVYLIHGGPQGMWSNAYSFRWNYQMFAAPGNVVAFVNPRGSTGYGQQFTDEISGDWGGKVYEDLMKGLDHVLDSYSFIDRDRVGAAGASFGGYMINWIAGHTDRFNVLVNHDGLYNFSSFYGTTEELWFPEWDLGGTPWDNPEAYAKYSPHTYAKNFKTPMLVVHGGKDYRVDPSEGFQTFTALQRQGVPSKLLYFPDEGHWVNKPQNAKLWWKTVVGWLGEYLDEDRTVLP